MKLNFDKVLIYLTISILFIFEVFGKGFANINIGGLPLFQLLLLTFSLLIVFLKSEFFAKIFNSHFWFFLLLFIIYCLAILSYSIFDNRSFIRIIQDAEVIYDIIFIFLGIYVSSIISIKQHKNIFSSLFITMFVYYSIIIIVGKNLMMFLSPKIGGVYSDLPAFGYAPSHTVLLCGAVYFFNNLNSKKISSNFILGSLLTIAALIAQKRFVLIQIIILSFFYFKNISLETLKKMINFIVILSIAFTAFSVFNINTQKGAEASLTTVTKSLASTFVENEYSAGVSFRKNIFKDYQKVINTPKEIMIGVGFGVPLSKKIDGTTGKVTRTPHIFILTVIGRIGLIGLTFIMSFLLYFFSIGIKSYLYEDDTESKRIKYFLIVSLIIYFTEAQINPTLEYAHNAFFRYYTLGCLIGINLKN